MDHFAYRDGHLFAEDVAVSEIANAVGTPFYCYSRATLCRHYDVFAAAFEGHDALVAYAVKANSSVAVIRALARRGAGAALVSGGELRRALAAGVAGSRMVFSGVGKTREEMGLALDAGILQFNVESEPELRALSEVATARGVEAPVAIRINPDVDAKVHRKITTGLRENKFGIEWTAAPEIYARAAALPGLKVVGMSVHIGSQLLDLEPFRQAFAKMRDMVFRLRADGHRIDIVDVGGGLGIPYDDLPSPAPEAYARTVLDALGDLGCRLVLEPGRMIAGNAGILVARLLYRKEGAVRTFYVVDAAMNDLLRPSLYDAYHHILPCRRPAPGVGNIEVDVVGPVCETGDTLARQRNLPPMAEGELLAVRTAGAYCAVMASAYNSRPLVPEVLVSGDRWHLARRRLTAVDLLDLESVPDWPDGDDRA